MSTASTSPPPPAITKPRSIVYIDGFNLYYGAIKGSSNKWLDLQRYFTMIRQGDDIRKIHYFTALVKGQTVADQRIYLQALGTLPLVNVVLGKFKDKQVQCHLTSCTFSGARFFVTQEEKRTDVNIAIHLLDDAYQNRCDRFVVVSGDSDLVPALNMVKSRFPKKEIIVYVPSRNATRGAATEIRFAADMHKTLPLNLLKQAQFPASVPDGKGGFLNKPVNW